MRALAAAAALVLVAAGAAQLPPQVYWRSPTTAAPSTPRPEEACRWPCRCLRLSRWAPRLRAHCVVVWQTDRRPHPPFQLDAAVDDVDFSHSSIRKLYAVHMEGLERVKVVRMNSVGLVSVTTNALDGLPDLWSLSLERNRLSSLSPLTFLRTPRLHHLSLRRNLLAVRPDEPLVAAAALQVLDVSECGLSAVYPATFRQLGQLRQLHLEGNLLRALPADAVAPLPQLARLFLQRNLLVFFPGEAIRKLPELLELRLEGNRQMQGALAPVSAPKLQRLSVADCALQSVQPNLLAVGAAPQLRYLDLSNNRLRELWLAGEADAAYLVLLDASKNPLQCDCALRDTWDWAEQHVHEAVVTCGEPATRWQDAGLSRLRCDSATAAAGTATGDTTGASPHSAGAGEAGAAALWATLSLLAVLAGVGGALLFVYRRELLQRFFSPQARAAASGGGDAMPLDHNHADTDVAVGLPDEGGGGGVAPWLQQ